MSGTLLATRNLLKAWFLLVGLCGLFGLAGWALGGYRLLSVFLFSALLLAAGVYWYAGRAVLGMCGGRELVAGELPSLHSTLERLAARAGVVKPRLHLLPDTFPRAFAVGRGPTGSAIALSSGLVAATTPAELEGILAHEVAHVSHRDVLVQTTVVMLASMLLELSRIGGFLQRALLLVLGPVAAACVHLLLSPKREFAADRRAAELCESPHGLADALLRLEQAAQLVSFQAAPATEPLYTINPFAEEGLAALFVTHPPVAERVRRLRELDPGWREKLRAA